MDGHRGQGAERDETGKMGETGGCAAFGLLLEAYYYHALAPDAAQSVAEHVANCTACSAALERFAATDQLIADAPMPAPGQELRQRLAARITTARAHRSDRSPDFTSSLPAERTAVVQDTNDANDQRETRLQIPDRAGRGVQWMRVLLGTVAAALVVALLAGMLLTRMHAPLGQINDGHSNVPTTLPAKGTCATADIKAHLPANSSFGSLDMVSPDEGWAIGGVVDPMTLEAGESFILHYHNCVWAPISTSIPVAGLSSLSMGSPTDGWAVGNTNGGGAPFALHYTGGVWKQVTPPGESALNGATYSTVYMLSANEGWITFNHMKNRQGYLTQGLLHLVNGRWSVVNTPFPGIDTVLPVAPNEAWVLGDTTESQQVPDLYHYRAGTWTRTTPPSGIWLSSMRMVAPNDIWASGQRNAVSSSATGAALHYDGSQWHEVPVGASGRAQDVEAFDQYTSWA
ncbi:MAG TPA: hypothetical protein VFS83_06060, partial [Ktedonobacterales bacterium]|nr:hypothetical protein [Ktedonobacterales bacterium]